MNGAYYTTALYQLWDMWFTSFLSVSFPTHFHTGLPWSTVACVITPPCPSSSFIVSSMWLNSGQRQNYSYVNCSLGTAIAGVKSTVKFWHSFHDLLMEGFFPHCADTLYWSCWSSLQAGSDFQSFLITTTWLKLQTFWGRKVTKWR